MKLVWSFSYKLRDTIFFIQLSNFGLCISIKACVWSFNFIVLWSRNKNRAVLTSSLYLATTRRILRKMSLELATIAKYDFLNCMTITKFDYLRFTLTKFVWFEIFVVSSKLSFAGLTFCFKVYTVYNIKS